VRLGNTARVKLAENDLVHCETALRADGRCPDVAWSGSNIDGAVHAGQDVQVAWRDNHFRGTPPEGATSAAAPLAIDLARRDEAVSAPDVPGRQDAMLAAGTLRGLKYILVDEWGPYDFARIKLVPDQRVFWEEGEIRVLGPDAPFRIANVTGGVEVSPTEGMLPAVLKITSPDRGLKTFTFEIELPERKETLKADGLLLFAEWDVAFYRWPGAGPMKPPADWPAVLASDPLERRKLPKIDFPWGGGGPADGVPGSTVPSDHFATVATTELELPAGQYEIRTVSDDGVRVSIDGQRVIDNWTWHPPVQDTAQIDLEAGRHSIRIEHFEIDGVSQLQFWITPPSHNHQN
jgi:hypothetical protein